MQREERVMSKVPVRIYRVPDRAGAAPSVLLLQAGDEHDLSVMDSEVEKLRERTESGFVLAAFEVGDWNSDLTPWPAPPVWGKEGFGENAPQTLAFIRDELLPALREEVPDLPVILGGYSLAGFFALWAGYTAPELFDGITAASPSVWYPGWMDFVREQRAPQLPIYLSLGTKEEKGKNATMRVVGDCIREMEQLLTHQGVCTTLEWNPGNHFRDPDLRTAAGFAWTIGQL